MSNTVLDDSDVDRKSSQDRIQAILRERIHHEEEILKHRNAISRINSELNELRPISRLLPEILVEIFAESTAPGFRARCKISHVCRYWRAVALNCPMLWCNITQDHPDCVSLLLARSKQLPLELTFSHELQGGEHRVWRKIYAEEMYRVSKMSLEYPPAIEIVGPARQLRELLLDDYRSRHIHWKAFLGALSSSEAPELQILCMYATDLDGSLFPTVHPGYFSTLKEFDLTSHNRLGYPDTLLIALDAMPLLENLQLHSCFDENLYPMGVYKDSRVTRLSQLYEIFIDDVGANSAANFLTYLDLPCVKRITIISHTWHSGLVARIHHLPNLHYACLTSNPGLTEMALGTQIDTGALRIRVSQKDFTPSKLFSEALPLAEVKVFTMRGAPQKIDMIDLYRLMPCLHTLRIHNAWLMHYWVALFSAKRCDTRDSSQQLEALEFANAEFPDAEEYRAFFMKEREPNRIRLNKFDRIVYKNCIGVDAELAAIMRECTGATSDNFLEA